MKSLVIGKFYPLHAGHEYLISTARDAGDELLVIVCWKDNEDPPRDNRVAWVKELFPSARVETIHDTYDPDDSELWAKLIKEIDSGVDTVFTSEDYGEPLAKYMGVKHVCVDKKRVTVPVSGTLIRNNPEKYWKYLSEPVRHFYANRYVLVGPESTGKTTMSKEISKRLGIPLVLEYCREYYEQKDDTTVWTEQDILNMRDGQLKLERDCSDSYEMICDTDTATILLWAERFLGRPMSFPVQSPTLYLISELKDSVFVQDGTRDPLETGNRERMEPKVIEMVKQSGTPYVTLTGTLEERIEQAISEIQKVRSSPK